MNSNKTCAKGGATGAYGYVANDVLIINHEILIKCRTACLRYLSYKQHLKTHYLRLNNNLAKSLVQHDQAIRKKQENIANSINATVINANVSMTDFNNAIGDIGSVAQMAQMQKMQNAMKGINKSVTQTKNSMGMMNNPDAIRAFMNTNKSLKEQGTQIRFLLVEL